MEYDQTIISTIRLWIEARKAVNEYTKRLVLDTANCGVNCSELKKNAVLFEIMQQHLQQANQHESDLLDMIDNKKIPSVLRNFIEARFDKGCASCWLTEVNNKHSDCQKKIDRYFRTQSDLLQYKS